MAATQVSLTHSFSVTSASPVASTTMTENNIQAVAGLEPIPLWKHFGAISSISRPSKKEQAALQYIKDFAKERGLEWKQDAVGNLAVFKPPSTKAAPSTPPVIIQGHVDMVTEKNAETAFDFDKDPIQLRTFRKLNGEHWMGATDTTLGADNGIGVAAALALLEDSESTLPPLQVLFTVDEETGLTGATELDASALGLTAKIMLNLDTEEWGELYVGCAGGGESVLTLEVKRHHRASASVAAGAATANKPSRRVRIKVEGLMGGHSGVNIHEGRANAILLCAGVTLRVLDSCPEMALVSITGGDKHNAIPRESSAVLLVPDEDGTNIIAKIEAIVQERLEAAQAEYGLLETNLKMVVVPLEECGTEKEDAMSLEQDSARRLLSLIQGLPHGPLKFSHAMPELVETSNNVASLTMAGDDKATILCSTRSSVAPALEAARDKLAAVSALAGARMERFPSYPGWNPNLQSPLLKRASRLLERQLGRAPGIKAIHAGLECGLLIEKLGGQVDALSFGPTIRGAHSPDECINIDTVLPFYEFLLKLLQDLAQQEEITENEQKF